MSWRAAEPLYSLAGEAKSEIPLALTASLPKQKHSRAKSRQQRRLVSLLKTSVRLNTSVTRLRYRELSQSSMGSMGQPYLKDKLNQLVPSVLVGGGNITFCNINGDIFRVAIIL